MKRKAKTGSVKTVHTRKHRKTPARSRVRFGWRKRAAMAARHNEEVQDDSSAS